MTTLQQREEIREIARSLNLFVSRSLKVSQEGRLLYECKNVDELYRCMKNLKSPPSNYEFKTKPFEHQRQVFNDTKNLEYYAIFWEMGTGKTKLMLDTAGWLYENKKINSIVIVAPNGVHRDWILEAVPIHLPNRILYIAAYWSATPKKLEKRQLERLQERENDIFKILTINVEGIHTKKCQDYIFKFLKNNKSMIVIDESDTIKNPDAKRTKFILKLRELSSYRRILTGTPITQSPLDLFTQFQFLNPDVLKYKSFVQFRSRYAELKNPALITELSMIVPDKNIVYEIYNQRRKQFVHDNFLRERLTNGQFYQVKKILRKSFMFVSSYKNLDELSENIKPYRSRILKKQCLDLPEKIYTSKYIEMSKEQRQIYNDFKNKLIVEIDGQEMSAQIILTKMLRLQQITGGFYTADDEDEAKPIPGENHKLNKLLETISSLPKESKIIIWARFTAEIKLLYDHLPHDQTVLYYGEIRDDEKFKAKEKFQKDPNTRFFVGNQASGGVGVNLTSADNMLYFSNYFSLRIRLQSEDRFHRIGQINNVVITDFITRSTLDEKVLSALKSKKDVADLVNQDPGEFLK